MAACRSCCPTLRPRPLLLLPPNAEGRDLKVTALRPVADGPRKTAVQAADDQGRVVARIELDFAATATKGEGVLQAPPELRNRMTRLDIEAQGGAGSTVLLDERNRRRPVVDPGRAAAANGQPLLQEVYFLERALDPYVSLTHRRSRNGADPQHRGAADPRRRRTFGRRSRRDRQVDRAGGVAVRFAGPNLAAGGDDNLVPVPLRLGDRALGGVMSWGQPGGAGRVPGQQPVRRHSRSPRTCASRSRCWPSRRPTSPTRPGRG